jgi:hypothetical protein
MKTEKEKISVGELFWQILRPSSLKQFIIKQYTDGYQLQTITNRYVDLTFYFSQRKGTDDGKISLDH